MRRMGDARDVAGAAFFLASDDTAYIARYCLVVDGGLTATSPGREGQHIRDAYAERANDRFVLLLLLSFII